MLHGDTALSGKKQGLSRYCKLPRILGPYGLVLAVCASSGLFAQDSSGIIWPSFDQPKKPLELELEELPSEKPSIDQIEIFTDTGPVPSLWNVELIGADLIRDGKIFKARGEAPVVVFDDLATAENFEEIDLPERKPRTIRIPGGGLVRMFLDDGPKENGTLGEGGFPDFNRRIGDFIEPIETLDPREHFVDAPTTHGMHVLGTIGAEGEAFGVSSVVNIYGADIFRTPVYSRKDDWTRAFESLLDSSLEDYALNLSLTMTSSSRLEKIVEQLEREKNAQLVVAAGNFGLPIRDRMIAGSLPNAIVVSAMSPSGVLANYSSYGEAVDLTAPGSFILSRGRRIESKEGELEIKSGTSMATPSVTGSFANLRALHPRVPAQAIREILYRTAWDLGEKGRDPLYGWGLMNSFKAVRVATRILERIENGMRPKRAFNSRSAYNLSRDRFKARLSAMRSKLGSSDRQRALRAYYMMASSPSTLQRVGRLYANSSPALAKGMTLMAFNRENQKFDTLELQKAANLVVETHNDQQWMNPKDYSALNSLANVDLVLAVSRHEGLKEEHRWALSRRLFRLSPRHLDSLYANFDAVSESF